MRVWKGLEDVFPNATFLFVPPPPYIIYLVHRISYIYIGWVGVGWQRRCKIRLSLRELDSQGTVFLLIVFLAVTTAGGQFRSLLCGGNLYSAQGG